MMNKCLKLIMIHLERSLLLVCNSLTSFYLTPLTYPVMYCFSLGLFLLHYNNSTRVLVNLFSMTFLMSESPDHQTCPAHLIVFCTKKKCTLGLLSSFHMLAFIDFSLKIFQIIIVHRIHTFS